MKKIIFLPVAVMCALFTACIGGKSENRSISEEEKPYVSNYDEMYRDSFDILLKMTAENPVNPNLEDSLYAKLYISVKTMASSQDNYDKKACRRTIKIADELISISNNDEYKIKYSEAKLIAAGFLKDKEEAFNAQKIYIELSPKDKPNRYLSFGMLYYSVDKMDSANFYFNKEISFCDNILNNHADEDLYEEAIMAKFTALMLLDRDKEARSFINSQNGSENIERAKNEVKTDEQYKQAKDYLINQMDIYHQYK